MNEEFMKEAFSEKEKLEKKLLAFLYKNYDKSFVLESRIKSNEKIKLKQILLNSDKLSDIKDIIGFRICVDELNDISTLITLFNCYWSIEERKVFDYYSHPKENGFKAYILQYESCIIPYEIQIMTSSMRDWVNMTHDEYDFKKYGNLNIKK